MSARIEIRNLSLRYGTGPRGVLALDDVSLSVQGGKVIGIVGESGSGKSTLGFAFGRLMPDGVRPLAGSVHLAGISVWDADPASLRALRQKQVRFIFQDPIAALDPTRRIGRQISEAVFPPASAEAVRKVIAEVGLSDPDRIMAAWPHELSGGMAQRVAIALAVIARPGVIVADEATSALDASVRARILDLLRRLAHQQDITLLLLSHDLRAVRNYCDEVAVMYAGRIIEHGPLPAVFDHPAHPYTRALLAATPGQEAPGEELATIPGTTAPVHAPMRACAFAPRCDVARQGPCTGVRPETTALGQGRSVLCHFPEEIAAGAP